MIDELEHPKHHQEIYDWILMKKWLETYNTEYDSSHFVMMDILSYILSSTVLISVSIVFLYPVLAFFLISRLAITMQTVIALCPISRLSPASAELSISKLVILKPLYSNASILSFVSGPLTEYGAHVLVGSKNLPLAIVTPRTISL